MAKHGGSSGPLVLKATIIDASSLSPFEKAALAAQKGSHPALPDPLPSAAMEAAPMQHHPKRTGLTAILRCSCFGHGSSIADTASTERTFTVSSTGSDQYDVVPHLHVDHAPPSLCKAAIIPSRRSSSTSPRKLHLLQPRNSGTGSSLKHASSNAYSDAEWHDAESHFSDIIDQDHAALEEVGQLVKELGSFKADWIPDPPLAFGTPGMQFVPVPAVTGFAAYWLRDDERTTPFPQPIDVMLKASYMVLKVHETIPGILIEETPTELGIVAKPGFLPPFLGINGYSERYDKSNRIEHSWMPRRDLKMGKASGKLYMTTDGMLIARVWERPAFSDKVDIILEEYMRLEQNGEVVVDRMTALHVASGQRATQYQVGFRRAAPKGMAGMAGLGS